MNSEAYIIDLLKSQDRRVISILYDNYGAALYGVVLRIVGEESIAEDVMQDTFIKVWKNGQRYDRKKGKLFTWLLNIARNTAIDTLRSSYHKNKKQMQSIDNEFKTNSFYSCSMNVDHIGLRKVVDELDEKYRKVIDLIYFKGFTQKEVKEELQIPLGTVKTRVKIGLRELRRIFVDSPIAILVACFFYLNVVLPNLITV